MVKEMNVELLFIKSCNISTGTLLSSKMGKKSVSSWEFSAVAVEADCTSYSKYELETFMDNRYISRY